MIKYSGRIFTAKELDLIRKIIKNNPEMRRAWLSREVCRQLDWRKPDGGLKDMRCRAVMIQMQTDGLIKLPAPMSKFIANRKAIKYTERTNPRDKITSRIDLIGDVFLKLVDKTTTSLWNEYIDRYHYLGFKKLPGAQLRYLAYIGGQIVACLGFGAAAWKTTPRDNWIGWSEEQKKRNLHLVINNARFLILPWIQSKNMASKLLSMVAQRLPNDWQERYNYEPVLLETFVDTERFTGTYYKASNWIEVGKTKGRGRNDRYNKYALPIKNILLFPMKKDFRKILFS